MIFNYFPVHCIVKGPTLHDEENRKEIFIKRKSSHSTTLNYIKKIKKCNFYFTLLLVSLYKHYTVWFCCGKGNWNVSPSFFLLLLILWNVFQIETYGVKFGISKYELNKRFNISQNDWNPCDWDPGIHELLPEPHASGYVKICTMRGEVKFLLSKSLATCELQVPFAPSVPVVILWL